MDAGERRMANTVVPRLASSAPSAVNKTSSRSMRRIIFLVLLAGCVNAAAQSYPANPVRVVVPFPPGGGNDSMGRMLAQKLTESFGKQFLIDNRGGANGMVGSELVAKAPKDGYTLHGERREFRDDAEPVREADLRSDQAVRADQPDRDRAERARRPSFRAGKNVKELIALAKAQPEAKSTSRAPAAAARRTSRASCSGR